MTPVLSHSLLDRNDAKANDASSESEHSSLFPKGIPAPGKCHFRVLGLARGASEEQMRSKTTSQRCAHFSFTFGARSNVGLSGPAFGHASFLTKHRCARVPFFLLVHCNMTSTSLRELPADVLREIFSHVPGKDMAAVSTTCRTFEKIAREDLIWQQVFQRECSSWRAVENLRYGKCSAHHIHQLTFFAVPNRKRRYRKALVSGRLSPRKSVV